MTDVTEFIFTSLANDRTEEEMAAGLALKEKAATNIAMGLSMVPATDEMRTEAAKVAKKYRHAKEYFNGVRSEFSVEAD
jgi:hypothetical protein